MRFAVGSMENFREISPFETENAMKLIGKDWMLITVKDEEKNRVNAMTASWGCLGYLWNQSVCVCFIRPQRYTYGLTEREERFSIAFLGEEHREALRLCGRLSGADCDKLSDAGLTSCTLDGVPVVSEAKLVMVCRKLYTDTLKESGFYDRSLLANYPQGDFHWVLIGKIEKVYIK